jgi:acyl-CoA synthetase (AMP-forming)/AMP-acid ligase II
MRRALYRDPAGLSLHQVVLASCASHARREAVVDVSDGRRLTYEDLGTLIERAAAGLVAAGLRSGDVVGIFLPNCWEYVVLVQAINLAGGIPTLLNPSYKEREVRYQLRDSGATFLATDGTLASGIDLSGLALKKIFYTRTPLSGSAPMNTLLGPSGSSRLPASGDPATTLAALPYSSGTTGLPKGVMLSHYNLVANAFQYLSRGEEATTRSDDRMICFLPLYHIYGFNVILNPTLMVGGTLVLMPRFDLPNLLRVIEEERITYLPQVPPVMNALCAAAESGTFPKAHNIRGSKSGAAPLAADLAKRFTSLTGIPVRQGYGMTEASPVTHLGFFEQEFYRPDTIGKEVAETDCRIVREDGKDCDAGEPGELVMRGPQFMLGYLNAPEATAAALRDGWYWSGDVAIRDDEGFYRIVDRRKELIKYKGFAIAPAEVEAVLIEHPYVRDCGVVGIADNACGEVPIAFVVPKEAGVVDKRLETELCGYVGERLAHYKRPHQIRFVSTIPRNPSGKILRKDLRAQL